MTLSPTTRSTVQRGKKRAVDDRAALYELLDRNLICHLGIVAGGAPRVLPTAYGRAGDTLYLHGSSGAHSLRNREPVCVTVTELNGIVYARSVFHFSANYASAVIHATPQQLQGTGKHEALRVITEHLAPGSWDYARAPSKKELAQTTVLAVDLAEASVKLREDDPDDEVEDLDSPVWAGVLPVEHRFTTPCPSGDLHADIPLPNHISTRK